MLLVDVVGSTSISLTFITLTFASSETFPIINLYVVCSPFSASIVNSSVFPFSSSTFISVFNWFVTFVSPNITFAYLFFVNIPSVFFSFMLFCLTALDTAYFVV